MNIEDLRSIERQIKKTEHLCPKVFSENEIGEEVYQTGGKYSSLTSDRYQKIKNAISIMCTEPELLIDDVKRETICEVHFKKEIELMVSETIKDWLSMMGYKYNEYEQGWSLKYIFCFDLSEKNKVIDLVNGIIDKYEENIKLY